MLYWFSVTAYLLTSCCHQKRSDLLKQDHFFQFISTLWRKLTFYQTVLNPCNSTSLNKLFEQPGGSVLVGQGVGRKSEGSRLKTFRRSARLKDPTSLRSSRWSLGQTWQRTQWRSSGEWGYHPLDNALKLYMGQPNSRWKKIHSPQHLYKLSLETDAEIFSSLPVICEYLTNII